MYRREIMIRFLDRVAKDHIKESFGELETKLGIEGLADVLTTAVLELVENAVKANLKRAFFVHNKFDFEQSDSYIAGMKAFKSSYTKLQDAEYVNALKELELSVAVSIDSNRQRLLVYVENNTIPVAQEEARIRRQLSAAMNATAFSEFCVQYGDSEEGGGLGLAMIVFLIRNLGFSPDNFRVYLRENRTIARLEFPLTKDYTPIRQRA